MIFQKKQLIYIKQMTVIRTNGYARGRMLLSKRYISVETNGRRPCQAVCGDVLRHEAVFMLSCLAHAHFSRSRSPSASAQLLKPQIEAQVDQ